MPKNLTLIIGGIAVVIIIGVVAFTQLNKSSTSRQETSQTQSSAKNQESISGSIASLLGMGRDVNCTFSYTDEEGNQTTGNTYIAGERMRGDYNVKTTQTGEFESHIIQDGGFAYSWTSLQNQGTKVKLEETDQEDEGSPQADMSNQGIDINQNVDFECMSWTADNSMFTPPANIEFIDLSAQLQQIQDTSGQLENQQENICNQLPGEAKQQCLDAINAQ